MFLKLFAESGLSLDRLRVLVEVGALGSIVKAAGGDPVRQSQYSRQIKELEDFFRTRLVERHGKGTRLTGTGRELARISRFFMMGLSNFQRGCLAEEETSRIGASATFNRHFLMPLLSSACSRRAGLRFISQVANDDQVETRLHDLTLDFGIIGKAELSRPLQTKLLGAWKLELWVPKRPGIQHDRLFRASERGRLPLVLAKECLAPDLPPHDSWDPVLICDSFVDSQAALEGQRVAVLLPSFMAPTHPTRSHVRTRVPELDSRSLQFYLAWNPRLLRLDPRAAQRRDWLADELARRIG